MKTIWIALASLAAVVVGCGSSEDAASDTGAQSGRDYDFKIPPKDQKLKRVDAMGVALTSTTLMNRDKDNENHYQELTPYVFKDPKTTISFIRMLRGLHGYWRDHLKSLGFEPCSTGIGTLVTPCTLQKFQFDDAARDATAPRVIEAVLPDYIMLDFDTPLGFPNGRSPWESISDKILAMGFLEMGAECPGIDAMLPRITDAAKARVRRVNGVPICTIETFADIGLQVQVNDRPFKEQEFPYLAEPWFYSKDGGASYFWPWADSTSNRRQSKP